MKLKIIALSSLLFAMAFTSCKKDDDNEGEDFSVNATYTSDNFDAAATKVYMTDLKSISSKMKEADPTNGGYVAVSQNDLLSIYNKNMAAVAPFFYDTTVKVVSGYFTLTGALPDPGNYRFDDAATYTPYFGYSKKHTFFGNPSAADPAGAGVNLYGPVEAEQLIEKSAYIGFCWAYTKTVLFVDPSAVTQENLDAALTLYGSDPEFSSSDWSAKYAAQNNVSSDKTFHDEISYNFRKAQSAIQQGKNDKKIEAVEEILNLWEAAIAAKTVSYLTDVVTDLAATPDYSQEADYEIVADAIHAWSEAVGFLAGFYLVQDENGKDLTTITYLQVGSILDNIQASTNGSKFDPLAIVANTTNLEKVESAISELETIYGLQ
jgi:hypothetical protein